MRNKKEKSPPRHSKSSALDRYRSGQMFCCTPGICRSNGSWDAPFGRAIVGLYLWFYKIDSTRITIEKGSLIVPDARLSVPHMSSSCTLQIS
jgi:hypothetical protein